MNRIRGLWGLARSMPREWFGHVEAHFVIDTLALGLMAASLALLGSLVV